MNSPFVNSLTNNRFRLYSDNIEARFFPGIYGLFEAAGKCRATRGKLSMPETDGSINGCKMNISWYTDAVIN